VCCLLAPSILHQLLYAVIGFAFLPVHHHRLVAGSKSIRSSVALFPDAWPAGLPCFSHQFPQSIQDYGLLGNDLLQAAVLGFQFPEPLY